MGLAGHGDRLVGMGAGAELVQDGKEFSEAAAAQEIIPLGADCTANP